MNKISNCFICSAVLFFLAVSCTKKNLSNLKIQTEQIGYDIIIVAGQSNALYGYGFESTTLVSKNVSELGRQSKNMQIIPANPCLSHWNKDPSKSGFGFYFAQHYYERKAPLKKKVLIIACAEAGSSFIENRWNPGDPLYEDLIYRSKYVLQNFPESKVIAVLWQQGESDVDNIHYRENLDNMIKQIRIDLQDFTIPFLLGGMVPFWTAQQNDRKKQQLHIKNTEYRLPFCYYVDPIGISKPDNTFDMIHYSHDNQQVLALRYWEIFKNL